MLRNSFAVRTPRRFAPAVEGMPIRVMPTVYTATSSVSEPISQPTAPTPNPMTTGIMAISTTTTICS